MRRRLGVGGMGVVYEAIDLETGELVALKTLWRLDGQSLYRFKQEFRALADLRHPNLVRLGELHHEGGQWFFTMERIVGVDFVHHVRGEPGAEVVTVPALVDAIARGSATRDRAGAASSSRSGPRGFDEAKLRAALGQLALGVAALHRAGTIHRDVKPSNILVSEGGRVVLLDFGLAAGFLDEAAVGRTGEHMLGTAPYMAPEQATDAEVGPAADWYAVGGVLFEALTGRPPFEGQTLRILLEKQRADGPHPGSLGADVPEDLDRLCAALLRRRPEERPASEAILSCLGVERIEAIGLGRSTEQGAPFVGREDELAALAAAYRDRPAKGAYGMIVEGPPGIGKTALVQRFLQRLAAAEPTVRVLAGRCFERESVPFKAFDGVIDGLSRHLKAEGAARVAALLPEGIESLAQIFPVLSRVPAIAARKREDARPDVLDPEARRARAVGALRSLLDRLAADAPLVIHVDDVHWADRDSRLLLDELLEHADAPHVFWVLTGRSGVDAALAPTVMPDLLERFRRLRITGLSGAHAKALLHAHLADHEGAIDAEILERIVAEADGHPLFLAELALYAAQSEILDRTLRLDEVVWARVMGLSDELRHLLELLSLAGFPMRRELLAEAAGLSLPAVTRAVRKLQFERLVRGAPTENGRTVEVYHDRVREAVSRQLTYDRRVACHRALATALRHATEDLGAPMLLVHHLVAAGETKLAAVEALVAAERLAGRMAFEQEAKLYESAIVLGDLPDERRRDVEIALADALQRTGEGEAAVARYLGAAEGASLERRAHCLERAAAELFVRGEIGRCVEVLESLFALAGAERPMRPQVGARFSALRERLLATPLELSPRALDRLAFAERLELDAFRLAARVFLLVDPASSSTFAYRTLVGAVGAGAHAHAVEAAALLRLGEELSSETGASPLASRCASLIARHPVGHESQAYAWVKAAGALGLADRGALDEARGELDTLARLERLGELPPRFMGQTFARFVFTEVHRWAGDRASIARAWDDTVHQRRRTGTTFLVGFLARLAALAPLLRDRPDELEALLAQPLSPPLARTSETERGAARGHASGHLYALYDLRARAELALYLDAHDRLDALADELEPMRGSRLARFAFFAAELAYVEGRVALARAVAGRARAHAAVERAAAVLVSSGRPLHRCRGELLRGCAHLWRGDRAVARTSLEAARAEASKRGAAIEWATADVLLGRRSVAAAFGATGYPCATAPVARPERLVRVFAPLPFAWFDSAAHGNDRSPDRG